MHKEDRVFGFAWYNVIYVTLALATFKHSAWGFSMVLEGPQPVFDINTLTLDTAGLWSIGTLLMWYFWGGLMATVADVGMYFTARAIRERNNQTDRQPWGLWLTYAIAAFVSAYTQVLYAVQHAAQLEVVQTELPMLAAGGWLYQILEYRLLILPLALPGMSFLYTVALKIQNRFFDAPKIGKLVEKTGDVIFDVKQAAKYTNYSEQAIRQKANAGIIGHKNELTRQWEFTKDELEQLRR